MKKQTGDLSALEAELRTHNEIMSRLSQVRGYETSYLQINGYVYSWFANVLPTPDAVRIARRQNHEELMLMIHKYGQAAPNESWYARTGSICSWKNDHILPNEVQEIIAERCVDEEIDAFISYQGFGLAGQRKFFKASNHAQRMRYLSRHGFLPEIQDLLRSEGNTEEIDLHIARHGMHFDWEKEIIYANDFTQFKHCVDLHEFSIEGQRYMCKKVPLEFFTYYISRWGLWEQVHSDLVHFRTEAELKMYIQLHRHLSYEGEQCLCYQGNHDVIMFYIKHKHHSTATLRRALHDAQRTDYAEYFACLRRENNQPEFESLQVQLISQGSENEIMEHIRKNRLCTKALDTLLERKLPNAAKLYHQLWCQ